MRGAFDCIALGRRMLLLGDVDGAKAALSFHCKRKRDVIITAELALAHILCGQAHRASRELMEASNQYDHALRILSKLSSDGVYGEDDPLSFQTLPEARSYAAITATYLVEKGELMVEFRRPQEAADSFIDAVKVCSEDAKATSVPRYVSERAFIGLSSLLQADGQHAMAVHVCRSALMHMGDSIPIRSALRDMLERASRRVEASAEQCAIQILQGYECEAGADEAEGAQGSDIGDFDSLNVTSLVTFLGGGPMCQDPSLMCEDLLSALNTGTVAFATTQSVNASLVVSQRSILGVVGRRRLKAYEALTSALVKGEHWTHALFYFRCWVLEDPFSAEAHFGAGRALDMMLLDANITSEKMDTFSAWVKFVTHHLDMSVSLSSANEHRDMIAKALCIAGRISLLKHQHQRAKDYFERALEASPDYATFEANVGLARIFSANGAAALAFSKMEEALSAGTAPASRGAVQTSTLERNAMARTFAQLGDELLHQNAFREAATAYSHASKLSQGLGLLYEPEKQVSPAQVCRSGVAFSKALPLLLRPLLFNSLGYAYYLGGNIESSKTAFKQALDIALRDSNGSNMIATLRVNLGLAYKALNDAEKAAVQLREGILASPDHSLAVTIQEELAVILSALGKHNAALAVIIEAARARRAHAAQAQTAHAVDVTFDGATIDDLAVSDERVRRCLVLHAHILRNAGKLSESDKIIDALLASGIASKNIIADSSMHSRAILI